VCNLAGIKNLVAKNLGTSNKIVNAQAAMIALRKLQETAHDVKTGKVENSEKKSAKSEKPKVEKKGKVEKKVEKKPAPKKKTVAEKK